MEDFLSSQIKLFLTAEDEDKPERAVQLHASSDLVGCIRKKALLEAGAPRRAAESFEQTRRIIGKGLHRWLQARLNHKFELLTEFDVSDGLPEGWYGTTDMVFKAARGDRYAVYDLKIISAAQAYFANQSSVDALYSTSASGLPMPDHTWQVSAYVYALRKMGYDVEAAYVCYWPIDSYSNYGQRHTFDPVEYEIDLIEEAELEERMAAVQAELEAWRASGELPQHYEPEQRLVAKPNRRKPDRYELHQKVHWKCRYCPFFEESCNPPHKEGLIGIFRYDSQGFFYEAIDDSVTPKIFPPGFDPDRLIANHGD